MLILVLALVSTSCFGKKNFEKENKAILEEGIRLYRSEKASWHGTDLFMERYTDQNNIGGYFSYVDGPNTAVCVFFSREEQPKVIGTVSFDSTYNIYTANVDLKARSFTEQELAIYDLRASAVKVLSENKDGFFRSYENTNYNIVPLIYNNERKVYILTGSQQDGTICIGNDYLLSFNNKNQLKSQKKLHQSLITFNYGKEGEEVKEAMHTHLPANGPLMTATDVCTLMLYAPYTRWKQHIVYTKDYMSFWVAAGPHLMTISTEAMRKINADQEKRHKKE